MTPLLPNSTVESGLIVLPSFGETKNTRPAADGVAAGALVAAGAVVAAGGAAGPPQAATVSASAAPVMAFPTRLLIGVPFPGDVPGWII